MLKVVICLLWGWRCQPSLEATRSLSPSGFQGLRVVHYVLSLVQCMGPSGTFSGSVWDLLVVFPLRPAWSSLAAWGKEVEERGRGGQEELCSAARETLWLGLTVTTTGCGLTDLTSTVWPNYTANIGNLARNYKGEELFYLATDWYYALSLKVQH